MDASDLPPGDCAQRLMFRGADVRGEWVTINAALAEVLARQAYPMPVRQLLGELLAAAVLLSSTLKFRGRLTLQARSSGQIPLLMAESTDSFAVRGIARGAEAASSDRFVDLLGQGQLVITMDPERGRRYQGVVPLEGDSLQGCLDHYLAQSEQLESRLLLACDGERAGGLLLQQLPAQLEIEPAARARRWEHLSTLAGTARREELLNPVGCDLVHRLFSTTEEVDLFNPRPVLFQCSCSRERSLNALSVVPHEELESLLAERGEISLDCEFCGEKYRFDSTELAARGMGQEPPTVH